MKKGNRISFIVVIAILLMHMTLISSATPGLKDIDGHRTEKIIKEWWSLGVIKGTPNQLYHPDSTIKKSEMVALINRVLGYENQAEEPYGDVAKGAWYAEDFKIAKSVGYLVPYDNGNISPDEIMTWEKALYSIDKAFRLPEATTTMRVNNEEKAYTYTRKSIRRVVEAEGVSPAVLTRFNPKEAITRAEFMEIMDNLIGYYINQPGTYQVPEKTTGLVVVNSQDVVLKDSTVEKDLYITERVGEGDVHIMNTQIKGRALLQGGGENSIKLYNCKIKRVIVDRKRGKIRIVADKDSAVEDTTLYTRAKLEAKDGNVFESVKIDIDKYFPGFDVELEGNFGNVVVDSEVDIRMVGKSQVKKIAVTNKGDCKIQLPKEAKIESLQIDGATKVEGGGQLDNVAVNVDNVKIEAKVDNVLIGDDIEGKPVINGEVMDKPSETKSRNGGSDSSSDSEQEDDTPNLPDGKVLDGYDGQVYLVESNDYYTLYSTSPLVKGLVSQKSTFVVEFKTGYAVNRDYNVKLLEYRDGYLRDMDYKRKTLMTTSVNNQEYIKRIKITPTLRLKYGRRYSLEINGNNIYNTSNQKIDSSLDVGTAFKVELYTGEEGPLTLVDQLNYTITTYSRFNFGINKYMYHSNKGSLVYSYKDQNAKYTEAIYSNDTTNIFPLEATGLGQKTQVTLVGAGDGITAQIPVHLRIIDPVDMEYVVDQDREYIQVTFKNGLYGDASRYQEGTSNLISLKAGSNLKYAITGQKHAIYLDDVVYKDGSTDLVQSFKVYPYKDGQPKDQFKFNRDQGYHASLTLAIKDEKGTVIAIDGGGQKRVDLLFKEKLYEDEYVIVSSSYPLVDGKLAVNSFIVMDFKEGYAGNGGFSKLRKPAGKDTKSVNDRYIRKMEPIKQSYISPYQSDVCSYLWQYNSDGYSFDILYRGITNIKKESLGLSNVKKLNLTTEDYKGEKDILAIGQFINGRPIAIGQAFSIPLDQIYYSKTGEQLSYGNLSLDNGCLDASINGSGLYLKAVTPGTTTISFDITNDKGAIENIQFTVDVRDIPVIVKYGEEVIESGETVGYLRVEANKGYWVLSEAKIPAVISILEDGNRYNSYMVEKESNGIFKLYPAVYNAQDDAYTKIPFARNKRYKVKGYINNFSNDKFYRQEFIASDFSLVAPPSFKKEIQIPKLTTGQVYKLDLKDYIEHEASNIDYKATVDDENIAKVEILEDNILKITATKTLPVDKETVKTTTSAVTMLTLIADDGITVPLIKELKLLVQERIDSQPIFFKGAYMMEAPNAVKGIYTVRLANNTRSAYADGSKLSDMALAFMRQRPKDICR